MHNRKQKAILMLLCAVFIGFLFYYLLGKPSDKSQVTQLQYEKLVAPLLTLLPTHRVKPTPTKCLSNQELRDVNFRHANLKTELCSGTSAYERMTNGEFPLCRLGSPFDKRFLDILRVGSTTAEIQDAFDNGKVKMYLYPSGDYASMNIAASHTYQPDLIKTIMKLAKNIPSVTFVDAGCHIGPYTVVAARLGLPTVSADANVRNLLRLRLTLDEATLRADLVWNAFGPDNELTYLNFQDDCNPSGGTQLDRAVKDTIPVMQIRSERLCGLVRTKNIVVKLDLKGDEADFLTTSGCLFTEFKAAAVQIEFTKAFISAKEKAMIVNFFAGKRYVPFRAPGLCKLDINETEHWNEGSLIWVHPDFLPYL